MRRTPPSWWVRVLPTRRRPGLDRADRRPAPDRRRTSAASYPRRSPVRHRCGRRRPGGSRSVSPRRRNRPQPRRHPRLREPALYARPRSAYHAIADNPAGTPKTVAFAVVDLTCANPIEEHTAIYRAIRDGDPEERPGRPPSTSTTPCRTTGAGSSGGCSTSEHALPCSFLCGQLWSRDGRDPLPDDFAARSSARLSCSPP